MRFVFAALLLASAAAQAQPAPDRVWTAAPVSPLSGSNSTVPPADRAGSGASRTSDAGPDSGAPFSGVPTGVGNSTPSAQSGDRSPGSNAPTPALSK